MCQHVGFVLKYLSATLYTNLKPAEVVNMTVLMRFYADC